MSVGEKRIGGIRSLGVRSVRCYASGEEGTPPPSGGRGRGMSFGFTPQKKDTDSYMEEPLDDHFPEYEEDHMAYYDDYEPREVEEEEAIKEQPYDGITDEKDMELDDILNDQVNGPSRLEALLDQDIPEDIPEHMNVDFEPEPTVDEKEKADHELMELSRYLGEPDYRKMKGSVTFQMYDAIEKPEKENTESPVFLVNDLVGEYTSVTPEGDLHELEVIDHYPDDRTNEILNMIKRDDKSAKKTEEEDNEKYKTIKGYDDSLGESSNLRYTMKSYVPIEGVPFDPPNEADDAYDIIGESTPHLGDPLFDRLNFVHTLLYRILRGGWRRSDKNLMKEIKRFMRFREWYLKSYDKRQANIKKKETNRRKRRELNKKRVEMMRNSDDYYYYSEFDLWLSKEQLRNPTISNTVSALYNNPKWSRKEKRKIITDINRLALRMEHPNPIALQKVRFVTRFDKERIKPESGSELRFDPGDWHTMMETLELDIHDQDRAEKYSMAPIDLNPPKEKEVIKYDAEGMPEGQPAIPTYDLTGAFGDDMDSI